MNYLQNRELRWNIPLRAWLAGCFILSIIFYAISGFSTIVLVKTYGVAIESNPILRMLFSNIGLVPGIIITGVTEYAGIAALLYIFRKSPFLRLFIVHSVLIIFLLISLNDFSHTLPANLEKNIEFVQISGTYLINLAFFIILGLLLTLIMTTNKNKKRKRPAR